jgi:hypothetical protein
MGPRVPVHHIYTGPGTIFFLLTLYALEYPLNKGCVVDWSQPHWSSELKYQREIMHWWIGRVLTWRVDPHSPQALPGTGGPGAVLYEVVVLPFSFVFSTTLPNG